MTVFNRSSQKHKATQIVAVNNIKIPTLKGVLEVRLRPPINPIEVTETNLEAKRGHPSSGQSKQFGDLERNVCSRDLARYTWTSPFGQGCVETRL